MTADVYLEVGSKRTFAGAIDWPGWCRSGRGEGEALATLLRYAPRYEAAVQPAGQAFRPPQTLDLVERLAGNATTDFGAPGVPPASDERPLDDADLARLTGILRACWTALDQAAEAARGIELTRGPRGGGRDLEAIVEHVSGADLAYLSGLGATLSGRGAALDPVRVREAVIAGAAASAHGELPPPSARRRKPPWTARYFIRRAAWHALDHAWEIEDRSISTHPVSMLVTEVRSTGRRSHRRA